MKPSYCSKKLCRVVPRTVAFSWKYQLTLNFLKCVSEFTFKSWSGRDIKELAQVLIHFLCDKDLFLRYSHILVKYNNKPKPK